MEKKRTQVEAIRDLIRNLGHLGKLLIEFIPALEGLMKTEADLRAALDKLTAAITALAAAVQAQPKAEDLTPDVATADGLTAQVNALAQSIAPPPAPPPTA